MTYYRGSPSYPHPTEPGKVLCYLRNRLGWRVSMSPEDAEKVKPYDLFQDRTGAVICQTVTGKKFALSTRVKSYVLFRHVVEWVDPPCNRE